MIINASIEARMTSTRLPGKVLKEIMGIPSLQLMIERVKKSKLIRNIIVATTINSTDDPIVKLCEDLGVAYHRGSEEDVMQRVLDTHKHNNTDIIVELTGDCPFIDPEIIDKCIQCFLDNQFDYVSNCLNRSFPMGMETEVFRLSELEKISSITRKAGDREHVSTYFYQSGKYKTGNVSAGPGHIWPELSLTLDTKEDYDLLYSVGEHFKESSYIDLKSIITFLKNNEDLVMLNKHIDRSGIDG